MMTPQEVSQHAFAKASFGGYNMAMVDEFLDLLTADYTALYKENAALKGKMKVLVDKVEEYRSTEDAMRKALLSAQRMADDMVREAEEKKDALLAEAEEQAREKLGSLRQEVENEQFRLTAAQNATTAYVSRLKELYRHEMEYLEGLSKLAPPAPAQPDPKQLLAQEIEASLEREMEEIPPVADPEDTKRVELEDRDDAERDEAPEVPEPPEDEEDGGLYADLREHARQPGSQRAGYHGADEEITGETRRIPSKEDLMNGLGYGRR